MTDRFSELAQTWDDHPTPTAITADFAQFIIHQGLRAEDEVLDYGCGTGLLGLRFAHQIAHLHGMDSSDKMLAVFTQKAETLGLRNVTASVHRFGHDPLPEDHCTLLVSSMVLHHLEDTRAFFAAAFKTIRPGGALAIADLDLEDGSFHPAKVQDVQHYGFDRQQLAGWLVAAGFEVPVFETVHVVQREAGAPRYPVFGLYARRP